MQQNDARRRRLGRTVVLANALLCLLLASCEGDVAIGDPYAQNRDDDSEGDGDGDDTGDGDAESQGDGDGDSNVGDGDDGTENGDGDTGDGDAEDAGAGDGDGDTGDGDGDSMASVDVPAGAHCKSVATWSAQATQFEEEVLELTNQARALGHNCDTQGNFGKTTAVVMDPRLRCSARLHTVWMATVKKGISHNNTDTGSTPSQRMTEAGYIWSYASENIAAGQATPEAVVKGWLASDGHCANIMSPYAKHIGVGYVKSGSPYWTQNFGKEL